MIKLCGNCAFWWDKHKIEESHKLGECCYNVPQLVMGQMQVPSAIHPMAGPGRTHTVAQQMGLSPPCTENRPGCHSHEWDEKHQPGPGPYSAMSVPSKEMAEAMADYGLKPGSITVAGNRGGAGYVPE